MNNPYDRLANAIVLQAVKEYRYALKRLKKHPCNKSALYEKQEIEQFFHSGWYAMLTTVDPEMLSSKLLEEVI